jgi:signal transduction histidine kinase
MLNYGLVHAFSQLADELRAKSSEVEISLSFNSNEESYEKKVQEHIYRVVQQAAENALEHGKAQLISISGTLQPNAIDILVEDDGAGFRLKGNDLAHLLETKHFGLAGMSERAALIGARLQIHSSPRRGTRVSLTWRQKD